MCARVEVTFTDTRSFHCSKLVSSRVNCQETDLNTNSISSRALNRISELKIQPEHSHGCSTQSNHKSSPLRNCVRPSALSPCARRESNDSAKASIPYSIKRRRTGRRADKRAKSGRTPRELCWLLRISFLTSHDENERKNWGKCSSSTALNLYSYMYYTLCQSPRNRSQVSRKWAPFNAIKISPFATLWVYVQCALSSMNFLECVVVNAVLYRPVLYCTVLRSVLYCTVAYSSALLIAIRKTPLRTCQCQSSWCLCRFIALIGKAGPPRGH